MIAIVADPTPLRVDADGVVRVGSTRVTLDTVVQAYQEGLSAEEIVQQYPVLDLGDVYAVISYYLKRRSEVDRYLIEQQSEAAAARKQEEERSGLRDIRQRLLARRL